MLLPILAVKHAVILVACLLASFCKGLEVERLGQAFDGHRN
jgi:hypothetical protein